MATHSNTLVWKMLWTEEPDRLQSMGSKRKELHKTGQLHINTTFNTNWVKNLPTEQETQVQSLGWEDPLEGEIATHSNIIVASLVAENNKKPLYLLLRAGIPQKKWSGHHGQQKSPKCSTWMQFQ